MKEEKDGRGVIQDFLDGNLPDNRGELEKALVPVEVHRSRVRNMLRVFAEALYTREVRVRAKTAAQRIETELEIAELAEHPGLYTRALRAVYSYCAKAAAGLRDPSINTAWQRPTGKGRSAQLGPPVHEGGRPLAHDITTDNLGLAKNLRLLGVRVRSRMIDRMRKGWTKVASWHHDLDSGHQRNGRPMNSGLDDAKDVLLGKVERVDGEPSTRVGGSGGTFGGRHVADLHAEFLAKRRKPTEATEPKKEPYTLRTKFDLTGIAKVGDAAEQVAKYRGSSTIGEAIEAKRKERSDKGRRRGPYSRVENKGDAQQLSEEGAADK